MSETTLAMCGLDCGSCSYREQTGCPGCVAARGKMFWGECKLATCCQARQHDHCGLCVDFPCSDLQTFAYDKEHGDPQGSRIANLRHRMQS